MKNEPWNIWLYDEKKREYDFNKYVLLKKVKLVNENNELILGHLEKADHNLRFVQKTLNLEEFNDWALVSAYYAIYHASLALCALKKYSTKDHLATLLILINEFYKKKLSLEDIETFGFASLEKEEVLYYIQAKEKRRKASYSTQKYFTKLEVENMQRKAISFVNKTKEIINSQPID